ncbi:hypothetical protein BH09PSE4_BH09PSE4_22750 [soil metagenome]
MRRLIFPALALLTACAATPAQQSQMAERHARDEAKIALALKGLVPGKPATCIDPRDATNVERHGDTLLYKTGRRLIYRTDTGGGCFGLDRGDIIVTKSNTGQLCRGDFVHTVDPSSHMQSGACTFGDFVPYTRPK